MTHNQPIFYIARLVLETCTPLSIATGRTDGLVDNLIVRDANGLPAIPGSSLAGVLRHAYQDHYDTETPEPINTNDLFGSAKDEDEKGNPSFVHLSWGSLHDQNDEPIEGLLAPNDKRWDDDILKNAWEPIPVKRDHVKLNHRNVSDAEKQGKFERISLTTGHRFSVELSLWSGVNDDPRWQNLLDLLQQPNFRLGGGTRRGLGQLKIVRCAQGQFDLRQETDFKHFGELTESLTDTKHLTETPLSNGLTPTTSLRQISIELTPLEGYRFGGGVETLVDKSEAELLLVTERCVKWQKHVISRKGFKNSLWKGTITPKQVLIPASGIKGALSHRVAYHYNALRQVFADKELTNRETAHQDVKLHVGEKNEAVRALFGYIQEKDEQQPQQEVAQMGCLIFNDVYLKRSNQEVQVVEYPHNGVDRFTGGVREGVLFSEEVVTDTKSFLLDITVVLPSNQNKTWQTIKKEGKAHDVWKALQLALNDLIEGRLAIGAGGGRGHGYFKGSLKEGRKWLEDSLHEPLSKENSTENANCSSLDKIQTSPMNPAQTDSLKTSISPRYQPSTLPNKTQKRKTQKQKQRKKGSSIKKG